MLDRVKGQVIGERQKFIPTCEGDCTYYVGAKHLHLIYLCRGNENLPDGKLSQRLLNSLQREQSISTKALADTRVGYRRLYNCLTRVPPHTPSYLWRLAI